jgi:DNA-directed RNA polymerase specialized sigma24 family protein
MKKTPSELPWYQWADDAYPLVFRNVYSQIRRWGLNESFAAEQAQEGTQHAFHKLVERKPQPVFEAFPSFVAYLQRAAINRVREELRRKKPASLDSLQLEPCVNEPPEVVQDVQDCLAQDVDVEDRKLLEYAHVQGLSDQAIAAILLPPDDRSVAARGQDLRNRRLAAERKFRMKFEKKHGGDS